MPLQLRHEGAEPLPRSLPAARRKASQREVPAEDPHAVPNGQAGEIGKRVFDIALALSALALLAPLIGLLVVALRLTMRGPILFAHMRVGLGGREFRCFKFRTMVHDAERVLEEHLRSDPQACEEWRRTQKLKRDPRVTLVGRALRKSSLDELPQLINVLRGEMSCVGPRPIIRAELDRYGDAAPLYLTVRPGMTGLWQVSGRSSLSYEDRVRLDQDYIRQRSLWLDLKIVLRTVPALLDTEHSC